MEALLRHGDRKLVKRQHWKLELLGGFGIHRCQHHPKHRQDDEQAADDQKRVDGDQLCVRLWLMYRLACKFFAVHSSAPSILVLDRLPLICPRTTNATPSTADMSTMTLPRAAPKARR